MLNAVTDRKGLLPYPVIAAAVRGEPDAVNLVIRHYSGYIAALGARTSYDVHGCPYSQVKVPWSCASSHPFSASFIFRLYSTKGVCYGNKAKKA